MKKTIPEQKIVVCDICGREIYTDQKSGDQWAGVRYDIIETRFLGLFGKVKKTVDVCATCYKKITGNEYTYDA